MQRLRVALDDRPLRRELELDRPRVQALEQPEVQERHAAVVQQQEVPRMRIARELPVAVEAAEEEAEHDLPDAVALGLRAALQLLEAARRARTRSPAPARATGRLTTSGTTMNGCPAKMRASDRWFWASSS